MQQLLNSVGAKVIYFYCKSINSYERLMKSVGATALLPNSGTYEKIDIQKLAS